MRLIIVFELATKTDKELYALLRYCFNELAKSQPASSARRNALASIENIEREMAHRHFLLNSPVG